MSRLGSHVCRRLLKRVLAPRREVSAGYTAMVCSREMRVLPSRKEEIAFQGNSVQRLYSTPRSAATSSKTDATVDVSDDGKIMTVKWSDGRTARFHGVWLRFNCRCTECWLKSGNMRTQPPRMVIPADTALQHADLSDDGTISLKFKTEGHVGEVTLDFLEKQNYEEYALEKKHDAVAPPLKKGHEMPEMPYEEMIASDAGKYKWLKTMNDNGVCLLRNVPITPGFVKQVAEEIAPISPTLYGHVFDVRIETSFTNLAYSSQELPFHMDLPYYESPPGIQFLHCLRLDEGIEGGETTFVDVFHVAETLREKYPDSFDVLVKVPVQHERIMDQECTTNDQIHYINTRPTIQVNHRGQITGVRWSPSTMSPLATNQEDVVPFYLAFERFMNLVYSSPTMKSVQLHPGDLVSINNRRMAHGRTEMVMKEGTVRHLQGVYVNIDDFQSKLQVLARNVGGQVPSTRTGNNSLL